MFTWGEAEARIARPGFELENSGISQTSPSPSVSLKNPSLPSMQDCFCKTAAAGQVVFFFRYWQLDVEGRLRS